MGGCVPNDVDVVHTIKIYIRSKQFIGNPSLKHKTT